MDPTQRHLSQLRLSSPRSWFTMNEQKDIAVKQKIVVALTTLLMLSPSAPTGTESQDPKDGIVQISKLPINLEQIKRKLAALSAADDKQPRFNLRLYLEVYGRAPKFEPLKGFDIHAGPVPFGGTQDDAVRNLWAPEPFRAPVANLTSLIDWLRKR